MKPFAGKAFGATIALVTALSLGIMATLSGCSDVIGRSSNDTTAVFQTDDATFIPEPVEVSVPSDGSQITIIKSGWWAKDGYIHYGLVVENPSTTLVARDTEIMVKSYDEVGNLLSSDVALLSFVGPQSTIGFAGTAGEGHKPDSVTIEIGDVTSWQDGTNYVEPMLVASVSEEDKGYMRYEFTGGVTNQTGTYVSVAPICILLEDEEGNILAGYDGTTKKIKAGRTKDYRITINTAPEHAQIECWAQWSTLNDDVNTNLAED